MIRSASRANTGAKSLIHPSSAMRRWVSCAGILPCCRLTDIPTKKYSNMLFQWVISEFTSPKLASSASFKENESLAKSSAESLCGIWCWMMLRNGDCVMLWYQSRTYALLWDLLVYVAEEIQHKGRFTVLLGSLGHLLNRATSEG